jgi:hypothetical protein
MPQMRRQSSSDGVGSGDPIQRYRVVRFRLRRQDRPAALRRDLRIQVRLEIRGRLRFEVLGLEDRGHRRHTRFGVKGIVISERIVGEGIDLVQRFQGIPEKGEVMYPAGRARLIARRAANAGSLKFQALIVSIITLRKYSRKSLPSDGFCSASSTVAIKNPSLSPAS